jgi:predicted acylesterase/phospholipase RssA
MTAPARPRVRFDEARRILVDRREGRAIPGPDELAALAARLSGPGATRLERRLLALAVEGRDDVRLRQRLARSTYYDPELPAEARLDRALEMLRPVLDDTDDQETLSLAGAIHKRRWELDGQLHHLERALDFYAYAHECHVDDEDYDGYPGINAAFILDLIAVVLGGDAPRSTQSKNGLASRRAQARAFRETVVARIAERADGYWQLVTVAEALFGLEDHDEARRWLERAVGTEHADWMRQSTARQLARLSELQGIDLLADPVQPAATALNALLPNGLGGVPALLIGKVGLALSGGGYRASLFHIGVLARLAELDVLRHVEVLSCVSGGSIVGAAYYLQLRRRLERTRDGELTRADYVALVEELAAGFRAGVRRNLRMQLLTNPVADARMALQPSYSRTNRAGELYEKHFYHPILETPRKGLLRHRPRPRMRDLVVRPLDEPADFRPQDGNWERRDKVPVLIINAASLNTGHAWQFTATWMGEPPSSVTDDVDRNVRLRRVYYDEAPGDHGDLPLGAAVAASAAVPGIFPPITLNDLYPDTTVRLSDGGAHDNQGVAGLLDQDCAVAIVSDASGQMRELSRPPTLAYRVLKRASSLLSSQVRRSEWQDLISRRRGGALRGLMFLHLRLDLGGGARDWIDCQDPQEAEVPEPPGDAPTPYGVRRDVQAALARMRTDLDAFSDLEATALMASGYRMASHEFPLRLPGIAVSGAPAHPWTFLADFDRATGTGGEAAKALTVLHVGEGRWLRPVRLALSSRPPSSGPIARRGHGSGASSSTSTNPAP